MLCPSAVDKSLQGPEGGLREAPRQVPILIPKTCESPGVGKSRFTVMSA